ncbi:MAG: SsrA-binding protein SmpB [Xanthomonadaceae bacterium]|nr:SsrA-binding protein SmpB [Xanthomonadaceae bacterium]
MSKNDEKKPAPRQIARNRRAFHDYTIEDKFEAGIVLEGWEVKSLRAGKGGIAEAYVVVKDAEAWLIGARIDPLPTAAKISHPDPARTRKLLLQRGELNRLIGLVERKGYTLMPLDMHWTRGRAKLEIGLAKGKKAHDKRASEKDRDWGRQRDRLLKVR